MPYQWHDGSPGVLPRPRHAVDLDHLAEAMSARVLHYPVTFSAFPHLLFGRKSLNQPPLESAFPFK